MNITRRVTLCVMSGLLIIGMLASTAAWARITTAIYKAEASAYCPCKKCCAPHADGKTAYGKNAFTQGLAADPKYYRAGTRLRILTSRGSYVRTVDDVGGTAIKGPKRFDFRYPTHREALNFGRQKVVKVEVISKVSDKKITAAK